MTRRHVSSGSRFEAEIGYARVVIESGWVFVSGTTGFDYATMRLPEGVVAQCRQCLENIDTALRQAGCRLDDVVRVRYILPVRDEFEPCWPLLREAFAAARPAATMIEAGLIDPAVRIEIEVTARLPQAVSAGPPPA